MLHTSYFREPYESTLRVAAPSLSVSWFLPSSGQKHNKLGIENLWSLLSSIYFWSHTMPWGNVPLILSLMQLHFASKDLHMHCMVLCAKGGFKEKWLGIRELYNNYQSKKKSFG